MIEFLFKSLKRGYGFISGSLIAGIFFGGNAYAELQPCEDLPGSSYYIDMNWMYVTEDNFVASIWIKGSGSTNIHDWGHIWTNMLKTEQQKSSVFSAEPYAVCTINNYKSREGRRGESLMTCRNSTNVEHVKENDLNEMASGRYVGIPVSNGLTVNTIPKARLIKFSCKTGIATIYSVGIISRGDILKNTSFRKDEVFGDKLYYSRTSWRPYQFKIHKDPPIKSEYKF